MIGFRRSGRAFAPPFLPPSAATSLTSAPAQNARPRPVMTITRTSSSASSSFHASGKFTEHGHVVGVEGVRTVENEPTDGAPPLQNQCFVVHVPPSCSVPRNVLPRTTSELVIVAGQPKKAFGDLVPVDLTCPCGDRAGAGPQEGPFGSSQTIRRQSRYAAAPAPPRSMRSSCTRWRCSEWKTFSSEPVGAGYGAGLALLPQHRTERSTDAIVDPRIQEPLPKFADSRDRRSAQSAPARPGRAVRPGFLPRGPHRCVRNPESSGRPPTHAPPLRSGACRRPWHR